MAFQSIDPRLLDKRESGDSLLASLEHARLSYPLPTPADRHENSLDHAFKGDDWDCNLDLDNVAPYQFVDLPDTVEHE